MNFKYDNLTEESRYYFGSLYKFIETDKINSINNFHVLKRTYSVESLPDNEIGNLIKLCISSLEPRIKIFGVYLSAVLYSNRLTHALSGKLINQLISQNSLISKECLSDKHAAQLLHIWEKANLIKILRPAVSGKDNRKFAVVECIIPGMIQYIEDSNAEELFFYISDGWGESVSISYQLGIKLDLLRYYSFSKSNLNTEFNPTLKGIYKKDDVYYWTLEEE